MNDFFRARQFAILLANVSVLAAAMVLTVVGCKGGRDAGKTGTVTTGQQPEPKVPAVTPPESGFQDVAAESGINFRMEFLPGEQGENFKTNLYDHGCGVVVADFDGDGHDDIYLLNQLGPNALYRNKGDGTFVDATEQAGVALEDRICVGGTASDYDNDGDQDLYVTTTRAGNVLFQNLGKWRFKDVTDEAGLTCIAHSQTAAFLDVDNDGFLDLFLTNSAKWTFDTFDEQSKYFPGPGDLFELAKSPKEYNILYRNNRDGTFTDVTEASGLRGQGWAGDVAVADFDEDGWIDIFVTNMFGRGLLYHNEGSGRFRDVTEDALRRTSWGAAGSRWFDLNNDGHLDLYVTDMHSDMWMPIDFDPVLIAESEKYPHVTGLLSDRNEGKKEDFFGDLLQIKYDQVLFGNSLFKNLGAGKFEEISGQANMETFWPWGIATGDFDSDGYEDVYIPSGMGFPYFYWRSYLMMNNGDETFTDRSRTAGIDPPARGRFLEKKIGRNLATRSSRCAATADFDNDGRLDLIVNNFNDHPYYFKNHNPRANYVSFKLRGTVSNWDAIGAIMKIHTGQEMMARQVQAAGGYLSQSSKTVHFGLGSRSTIDWIDIRWPNGLQQRIDNPAINTLHELTEPTQ